MIFKSCFVFILLSLKLPAFATIYITAFDSETHSIGMAAISGGNLISAKAIKGSPGAGLIGWSGNPILFPQGLDQKVLELMKQNLKTSEIESLVAQELEGRYARFIFIKDQGEIGYVFPESGCGAPECGVMMSQKKDYLIMGGGLERDVVPHSMERFEAIQGKDIPFECKLLQGLASIVEVGGEVKTFRSAEIRIQRKNSRFDRRFTFSEWEPSEEDILKSLQKQMIGQGINCRL